MSRRAGLWLTLVVALIVPPTFAAPAGAAVSAAAADKKVTALIATLARSGIAVVDQAGDAKPIKKVKKPASPVSLSRWQVQDMVGELDAHGGVLGRDIDGVAPLSIEAPPMSYLLAGYVTGVKTPGATAARRMMGQQDWSRAADVQYPMAVLALFVADVAKPGAGQPTTRPARLVGGGPGRSVHAGSLGVCKAIADFTSGVLSAVYDALTFEGPSTVLTKAWNVAVDIVFEIGGTIVGSVLSFTEPIKKAIGLVAAVDLATSLFRNWQVEVTPNPSANRFSAGSEAALQGTFTAKVDTGLFGGEWPTDLTDCASLIGITLPAPRSQGAPAAWSLTSTPLDPVVATPASDTSTTVAKEQTTLQYTTGHETEEESTHGEEIVGFLGGFVDITRIDAQKFKDLLKTTLLGIVPESVAPIVNPALGDAVDPILERLTHMADAQGGAGVAITYHGPPIPIDPCLVGSWVLDALGLPVAGVSGGTGQIMTIQRSGKFNIDYNLSDPVSVAAAGGTTSRLNGYATGTFEADNGKAHTTEADTTHLSAVATVGGNTIVQPATGIFGGGLIEGNYTCNKEELAFDNATPTGAVTTHWVREGVPDVIYAQNNP